jgi:hypothetical protein
MISPKINNLTFDFVFDTGSDITVSNFTIWEKIGRPIIHPFTFVLYLNGIGGKTKAMGRCKVWVEIRGIKKQEWIVIAHTSELIFGRN